MQNWLSFQQKTKSKSLIFLFRFLLDQVQCQKWIKAISQENLKISDSCRIGAKHFIESDV